MLSKHLLISLTLSALSHLVRMILWVWNMSKIHSHFSSQLRSLIALQYWLPFTSFLLGMH